MKTTHVLRTLAASGVLCLGLLATTTTASFAVASKIPISESNPLLIPIGTPPPPGKGISFSNCSSFVEDDFAAMGFIDGNGHVYGPTSNPGTNGANVEGTAVWLEYNSSGGIDAEYIGHGHAWFGQNTNPTGNLQMVTAQTIMFHGTNVDDPTQTLDVQASFGGTTSASGNQSGWGHLKVTC